MWKVWRLKTKINSGLKQTNVPQGGRVTAKKTGEIRFSCVFPEVKAIKDIGHILVQN
jgi:hypothetical protein